MATSNYVANFNLTSWANAQAQLNSGNPQDVTIPIMNENGDITNVTVPNRGMFQKRVWDDVGGALGQFNRTFYIDTENGDDNNDGSENSPFKTLQKAVDSVPFGGFGFIYLIGNNNPVFEDIGGVQIVNKRILLDTTKAGKVTFKGDSFFDLEYDAWFRLRLYDYTGNYQSKIIIDVKNEFIRDTGAHSVSIALAVKPDDDNVISFHLKDGIFYKNAKWANLSASKFNVNCWSYNGNKINMQFDNKKFIKNESGNPAYIFEVSGNKNPTLIDGDGNSLEWSDVISPIVKDSDDKPRNIVSNIIF